MAGEQTAQTLHHPKQTIIPDSIPVEEAPQSAGVPPIQQLQRLIGNQRTQQLLSRSTASVHPANMVQRAPGLPPVRGVLQREDEADIIPASVLESRSSAAAAYAAVPDSEITLTDAEIQRAILYNQHRFPRQSISALRRYFEQPEGTQFDAAMIRAIARYQQHFNLGTDGMIGRTTYEHIDLHQLLESTVSNTPTTDADLIFSINVNQEGERWDYNYTSGTTAPMTFRAISRFSVEVLFPQHANPQDFRYRQMIKGRFVVSNGTATRDWASIFSRIPGTGNLPADFTEDGNTDWASTGIYYGRRSDPGQPVTTRTHGQNQYFDSEGNPDQARGHRYMTTDGPHAQLEGLAPGTTVRLEMEFLGQIVRIATGEVMQQKRWVAFNFNDVVPTVPEASG